MRHYNMKFIIIGHFAQWNKEYVDGQTTKTRNLYTLLSKYHDVLFIDTYKWKKNPFKLLFKIIFNAKKNNNFIILPDANGVKIIPLITYVLKRISKIKIYYAVVGAWLPNFLSTAKKTKKIISDLDGVWVETQTLKNQLENLGLKNVFLVNNYKNIQPISESELIYPKNYSFVIFSRINKLKGITDVIEVLQKIKTETNINITLDIYGPIDNDYLSEFNNLIMQHNFIKYFGIVDSNVSVQIIKNYFMLLFPTKYYTEGTPGTIIDSLFAGVPIIASCWASAHDVLNENVSIIYEFNNNMDLKKAILYAINNQQAIYNLKKYCLLESMKYTEEFVINQIHNLLK